jgi:hypothetical protein
MTAQRGTGDGGGGVASRKETRAKDGDGRVVASAVGGDGGDEDIGRGSTTAIVAALAAVGLCIFPVNPPEVGACSRIPATRSCERRCNFRASMYV